LGRIAEGVDEGVIPGVAGADRAAEAGELACGTLEAHQQVATGGGCGGPGDRGDPCLEGVDESLSHQCGARLLTLDHTVP
jgi:hypothetical protein